jgi:hypothetical protein
VTRSGKHTAGIKILWAILLVVACSGDSGGDGKKSDRYASSTRSFFLGFTPFPHDISQNAIDYVYARLAANADIVAHHFDEGVPWSEALAGTAYDQIILDDWDQRRSNTPDGHKIYVAITPINWTGAENLAGYLEQKT